MNYYLLPPEKIDEWWPMVQPWVEKVLTCGVGPELYNWWDIYSDCKNERSMCLVSEDWSYAAFMSVVTYPKAKVLDLYLCAGVDNNENLDWSDIDKVLYILCDAFDCKYSTITGRRGWEKVLKPLGYVFGNTMVMKEV